MPSNRVQTLERGNVYFLFRPRIEEENPERLKDVERMFVVLSPEGLQRYRLLVIERKRFPEPEESGQERHWGFVDIVREEPESIELRLDPQFHETKTRGERYHAAVRHIAEGVYRIVRHDGHTHFAYALELPKHIGKADEVLNLQEEASFVMSIKNPENGAPLDPGLSEEQHVQFPRRLQEKFRGRRFCEADPPDFLNHEGAEFVLISAAEDAREELGIELHTEDESVINAEIFKGLEVERSIHSLKPLFKGEWQ
jgi:hypothetical protein